LTEFAANLRLGTFNRLASKIVLEIEMRLLFALALSAKEQGLAAQKPRDFVRECKKGEQQALAPDERSDHDR